MISYGTNKNGTVTCDKKLSHYQNRDNIIRKDPIDIENSGLV